ncbi:MAG: hypothetical protein KC996_07315 [Phycisphaerales bacterium]|nr:hypothetical protein [Phycisphaerales bacterium]
MQRQSHQKFARSLTFLLCLGMLAGVLIWAKLRLVTDIPRSAYADPQEQTQDQIDPAPMPEDSPLSDDQLPIRDP